MKIFIPNQPKPANVALARDMLNMTQDKFGHLIEPEMSAFFSAHWDVAIAADETGAAVIVLAYQFNRHMSTKGQPRVAA